MRLQSFTALPVESNHVDLTAAAAAVTTNISTLIPTGKTLVALAYSILAGTANVMDVDGTVATNLPAGYNGSWSSDNNGKLAPPTSIVVNANSRVMVTLTVR